MKRSPMKRTPFRRPEGPSLARREHPRADAQPTLAKKSCAHCGSSFTPARPMQNVCGPVCARRKVEADKKTARESDKARSNALKSIAQLIAEAQVAFNAYVRDRDREKGCFVCGRSFENSPGRVMHAGHVRSRGAAGHLRFHEDNCLGECEGCNGPHGAKPHQIESGAVRRIGQERFDALKANNTPRKWTREELVEIKTHYQAKRREMRKKHGTVQC